MIRFLDVNKIPYEVNVDLKKKTWIHRGGIAAFYIVPSSLYELKIIVTELYKCNIPFLVIGHTSNIYIKNSTNLDVVISTIHCNKYKISNNYIVGECGVNVKRLSLDCINRGLAGLEYLTCLPGTVAAAIYNNSSCRKSCLSDYVTYVEYIDRQGEIHRVTREELGFEFRTSNFKKKKIQGVIISWKLQLAYGNSLSLRRSADENEKERYRLLEGPKNNLGSTIDDLFYYGNMPLFYRIPYKIFQKIISLFYKDLLRQKIKSKRFLLFITKNTELSPYISDKQYSTFIWANDDADLYFERYKQFMLKVFRTDKVEIEVF